MVRDEVWRQGNKTMQERNKLGGGKEVESVLGDTVFSDHDT